MEAFRGLEFAPFSQRNWACHLRRCRLNHEQSRRRCFKAVSQSVTDRRAGRMASKKRPKPASFAASFQPFFPPLHCPLLPPAPQKPAFVWLFFATDSIATKPLTPCDGGVFRALNLLLLLQRNRACYSQRRRLNHSQSGRRCFLKAHQNKASRGPAFRTHGVKNHHKPPLCSRPCRTGVLASRGRNLHRLQALAHELAANRFCSARPLKTSLVSLPL